MSYRFASLSSGLLARKGAAIPAMTSHGGSSPRSLREQVSFVTVQEPEPAAKPLPSPTPAARIFEPSAPPPPPFPEQRIRTAFVPSEPAFRIAPSKSSSEPAIGCGGEANCAVAEQVALDPAKRFHVSVRLRQGHFVRLKLASAQLRKPSQDIVADALTAYFRSLDPNLFGDCACSRD
jgi:hypothetical protein